MNRRYLSKDITQKETISPYKAKASKEALSFLASTNERRRVRVR